MPKGAGQGLLALSGMGFPLTQLTIRRFGRGGALAVEGVCAGLLVRDAWLIASGAPRRLRRGPAMLLVSEVAAGLVAVAAGLGPVLDPDARARATAPRASGIEAVRRTAIGVLFGLHTLRFRIYLRTDRGLLPGAGSR